MLFLLFYQIDACEENMLMRSRGKLVTRKDTGLGSSLGRDKHL